MSIDPVIARRTALAVGLAGAGTVALAACGSSSSANDTKAAPAGAGSDTGSTTTSSSSSSSSSSSGSTSSSSTPSSAAGGSGGTELATLDDIKVGEAVSAKLNGKPVIVARPTATTAACFSAICTHQGCTVAPAGKQLDCPCHGSVYNATTGAVIQGPAPSPLPKVNVTVSGGKVVASG